jgi:hypothetical protein
MLLLPRRHDFGDDTVAVGDDDRLAGRGPTDIFAELVLQNFEADGGHSRKVASGSYFVNSRYPE